MLARASVLIDVEYLVVDLEGDVDALLSQLEDETIWAPVAEVIAYRGEPEGFPWRG